MGGAAGCDDCDQVYDGAPPCGDCPRAAHWGPVAHAAWQLWLVGHQYARDGMTGRLQLAALHDHCRALDLPAEALALALDLETDLYPRLQHGSDAD